MRHLLLTMAGQALYAKRKCTVEPVFGIIKAILGFRQFSLRGLKNVKGEFNLVAMAWNLKRMFVLAGLRKRAIARFALELTGIGRLKKLWDENLKKLSDPRQSRGFISVSPSKGQELEAPEGALLTLQV